MVDPLGLKKPLLFVAARSIFPDPAACRKHPMARHDDREWIIANRSSHCARCTGMPDFFCQLTIRHGLPEGNFQKSIPHALLEIGSTHDERYGERSAVTGEIFLKLVHALLKEGKYLLLRCGFFHPERD